MFPSSKLKLKILFNDALSTDRFERTTRDQEVCEHILEWNATVPSRRRFFSRKELVQEIRCVEPYRSVEVVPTCQCNAIVNPRLSDVILHGKRSQDGETTSYHLIVINSALISADNLKPYLSPGTGWCIRCVN
jgi:hypothetical protein